MKQLRLIIVDDEKRVRVSLLNIIKLHCTNVIVVGEAEDLPSAISAIRFHKPDVILLDINMPGGTGIDLLKQLVPLTLKVIFITAFDQYAIQAIKFSALDYLLKPVIPEELAEALKRASKHLNYGDENVKVNTFMGNMGGDTLESKKIVLNTHEATYVINVNEIIRCEADRNYTRFFLSKSKTILVSGGLKEYDDLLSSFSFIRCHHSHLINLAHVVRLEKKNGGILVLNDGSEVPVSVRKYHEVSLALNSL